MFLRYDNLIMYWGIFLAVFFLLSLVANMLFFKMDDRHSNQ
jgi:hypothetical protein